jgi:diguanylate cyclase (GGDEF)-like protein
VDPFPGPDASRRLTYPIPLNEAGRISSLRLLKLIGVEEDPWWDNVTRLAARICGTPFAAVNLIEATYQYSLGAFGYEASEVDRGLAMCAVAITSPTPTYTGDASRDAQWADHPFVSGELDSVRTYYAAPLTLPNGHTIGTLCTYSRSVTDLTADQLEAMKDLAELTVRMLEIRERSEQFSQAATRDPLTELPNRALMSETLGQALRRHSRGEANVAVVFLDLDHFKPVNDRYGHGVGDELLRVVATRMLGSARSSDMVARVGGDEFVIICSSVPEENAPWSIDRVIEEVRMSFAVPFILSVGPVRVGASIGIAYASSPVETAEGILARADRAMYANKAERSR